MVPLQLLKTLTLDVPHTKTYTPLKEHPSLGSMTEGPIDTSETLMPIPKFGQGLFIYIFLSPAEMIDFMHPK